MLDVINEDHNGNINMLLIGGDKQHDGKIQVVSMVKSDQPLELYAYPEKPERVLPYADAEARQISSITREFYYPEKFYMGNRVMKFYRHDSLTTSEAYVKLFNGYQGGQ